jgi:hypothetical protein
MNESEHLSAHGARKLPPAPSSRKLRLVSELVRAHHHRLELDDAHATILEPRDQGDAPRR